MSYQDLPVAVFLDRVADMPDIEAKEQIVLRQDRALLELSLLMRAREVAGEREAKSLSVEIMTIQNDLGRLKRVLTEINVRMARIEWARAVTAIFGQEGYVQCRQWMEMNRTC